ncbi:hypothetical protein BJ964_006876 [Actinoplanes lobatus]|uniref:Uncharacterized protein n=1 Tax=Actinoplanes lobatus TaxID=113568 RepID=A0A7W7MK58_9ACTN|nr:hypothetical protein [Actinoplanes lobatus]
MIRNPVPPGHHPGAYAGLWVWDLTGSGHPATFSEVACRIGG